ncbi:MAG: N-acetylmannosamine-6-phosphate 2-epimerase [Clostridiaceae bacterium]
MRNKEEIMKALRNEVIVSCQALPEEPLHSSFIMGKMAYAAYLGGARGIRANSVEDIREIKKTVDLPIIGIIKKVYDGCEVFITPTLVEIDALFEEGVDIIALDATNRIRPDGMSILEEFKIIRSRYPQQLFMADCSTYEEVKTAVELGFDFVGTTLSGYTPYTKGKKLPDIELIERIVNDFDTPVIAEGGISTPEELKEVFDKGVFCAVVGSAITRPMEITKRFISAVKGI